MREGEEREFRTMPQQSNSEKTPQERAGAKYREALAQLGAQKGQRNARLLGLATLGILAGLEDCRILAEVKAAGGLPPLTDCEILHALRRAHVDTSPLAADNVAGGKPWTPPPPKPPPLGGGAASFVPRMIARGRGATFGTLAACSPVPVPEGRAGQVGAFLSVMYGFEALLYCGESKDRGELGRNIISVDGWLAAFFRDKINPPELLIANPLTGRVGKTKEGKPSFRCASCVDAFRFALVEFDAMPIEDQAAFWAGVIDAGTLPLRSLVYSGSKSIHGLVEIGAGDQGAWVTSIDKLLFATCHPDAPKEYQADRACKNPDRLTRLAGAYRADKGSIQTLLWLACGRAG